VLASDALGDQIVLLDAGRLLVADPGEVEILLSGQADVEMSDAPSQHAVTPVGTSLVSMYQNGCTAVKMRRRVSWSYNGAIAIIDGVNYVREGGSPSPA
jgi:hypothetical protein